MFREKDRKIQKFPVPEIDRDSNETVVTVSQKIKFIDSARFMATSVSGLADNLTAETRKIKQIVSVFLNKKVLRMI